MLLPTKWSCTLQCGENPFRLVGTHWKVSASCWQIINLWCLFIFKPVDAAPFPKLSQPPGFGVPGLRMPVPRWGMPGAPGFGPSQFFGPFPILSRGHELMHRLCTMNPQFASSVLVSWTVLKLKLFLWSKNTSTNFYWFKGRCERDPLNLYTRNAPIISS